MGGGGGGGGGGARALRVMPRGGGMGERCELPHRGLGLQANAFRV